MRCLVAGVLCAWMVSAGAFPDGTVAACDSCEADSVKTANVIVLAEVTAVTAGEKDQPTQVELKVTRILKNSSGEKLEKGSVLKVPAQQGLKKGDSLVWLLHKGEAGYVKDRLGPLDADKEEAIRKQVEKLS